MDAGLRPRAVMAAKGAIRLRTAPGLRAIPAALSAKEVEWLGKGWWSPIGAVRPAVLIARVEEAVRRAVAVDPAQRAAREVGFLTWPAG